MKRLAILLLIGLLAGCSDLAISDSGSDTPQFGITEEKLANGTVCRIGRDGGPVVADRGIGGTGAPRVADRGIGGTGIVGVVTGFASICVNGLEVRFDHGATVDIDGVAASTAALRAGQVVAILASGPSTAPVAQTISVRREVVGQVEAVELGSGMATIAGQPVAVVPGTWGAARLRLGDWVSVSGLRNAAGTLVASRLDSAPGGAFAAHGKVVVDGTVARVGGLTLSGTAAQALKNGQYVTISGHYVSGRGQVTAAKLDPLAANPADYFGSNAAHLVLEAFVHVTNGAIWLDGQKISTAPGVSGGRNGLAIVTLDRKPDGTLTAVGLRYTRDQPPRGPGSRAAVGMVRSDPAAARRANPPAPVEEPTPEPSVSPPSESSPPDSVPAVSAPPGLDPSESLPLTAGAATPVKQAMVALNSIPTAARAVASSVAKAATPPPSTPAVTQP